MAVRLNVMLGSFARVVGGMRVMPVRGVRVMSGFFVIAGLMVLGGFFVVAGCVLMVLSSVMMMLCSFLRHFCHPLIQDKTRQSIAKLV